MFFLKKRWNLFYVPQMPLTKATNPSLSLKSEPSEKARLWRLFPFSHDAIC